MISTIEYSVHIEGSDIDKVAIYNDDNISYEAVCACIETDTYNPNFVTINKDSFKRIFVIADDEETEVSHEAEEN